MLFKLLPRVCRKLNLIKYYTLWSLSFDPLVNSVSTRLSSGSWAFQDYQFELVSRVTAWQSYNYCTSDSLRGSFSSRSKYQQTQKHTRNRLQFEILMFLFRKRTQRPSVWMMFQLCCVLSFSLSSFSDKVYKPWLTDSLLFIMSE